MSEQLTDVAQARAATQEMRSQRMTQEVSTPTSRCQLRTAQRRGDH